MDVKIVNIIAVVNEGYSDKVMEIAVECGAKGGTIIPANGSVTSVQAQQLYGIGIHPEKEIVMILISEELSEKLLSQFYDILGNNSDSQGIFFTLPVLHATDNITNQYKTKKETK